MSQESVDAVVIALMTVDGDARALVPEARDDVSAAGAERLAARAIALFEGVDGGAFQR